jgi:hypothetical protein
MITTKRIFALIIALMLFTLTSCTNNGAPNGELSGSETSGISSVESSDTESSNEVSTALEPAPSDLVPADDVINLVDERFELLSLVFRLAGREEYNDADTEYQQKLASEFDGFMGHKAVKYATDLPLGYDAVFNYSVHIVKDGDKFALIDDIGSLVEDGRWTNESATEFLPLINEFYADSNFAAFYQSNLELYKAETKRFVDAVYSKIDLEWFGKYVDSDNLRCVFAPSSTYNNYGATVNGAIIYCAVTGNGDIIVHEYCHSFANPISAKWYEENADFKRICDDTVDPDRLPTYPNGFTIAGEYVTRAYNALYYVEHGYAIQPLLYSEKGRGFSYIEDVYAMIAPYEKPAPGDDAIADILGVQYDMGEEKMFSLQDRVIRWRVLSLAEPLSLSYYPTEVGNVFGSNTGDVLYVEGTADEGSYLLIDLGDTTFRGTDGYRSYSRIPIE